MAVKYCETFFYPEKNLDKCPDMLSTGLCNCKTKLFCRQHLHLNNEEYAILDNLRIVKAQNAEILRELTGKSK